jgi:predicted  nucleic acid-binding Zn-ribbon protein
VLCCALGCVILLWLLNAKQHDDDREERDREVALLQETSRREREERDAQFAALRTEHKDTSAHLAAVRADRESAYAQLGALDVRISNLESERSALQKDVSKRKQEAAGLAAKLKQTSARVRALEADVRAGEAKLTSEKSALASEKERSDSLSRRLSQREAEVRARTRELDGARKAEAAERARVRELQRDLDRRGKELAGLTRDLEALRSASRTLRLTLAARDKELAAARAYHEKWESAEGRARALDKQMRDGQSALGAASRSIAELQGEKKRLQAEVARVRSANENKFAGISLTGRRVIFLVDMSGSMEMVDENTMSPEKWAEVCNAVAQLLRSMPDLEQFQIITFAGSTAFPLGNAGRWIAAGPDSASRALKALKAIKPKGGTNMYAALEAAFKYRELARPLDTVYLLSDGLPNQGPGLPRKTAGLSEARRGQLLSRHVRDKLRTDWNRARAGKRVRINTIGFFYESPDLGSFLWALARENDGSFVGMSRP